jgi:hypothetical protein
MSGLDDHNYTNLPSGVSNPSSARILSANEVPGASQQSEKKPRDLAKLSNLTLLVGVMVFVGSIAFAIQRSTSGLNSRADTNAALVADKLGAEAVLNRDLLATAGINSYPTSYNGKPIKKELISQGEEFYRKYSPEDRKKYVINLIVLYYALTDALKQKSIETNPSDFDFNAINQSVKSLKKAAREKIISQADYVYIKANFSYISGSEMQAKTLIDKYHDMLAADPNKYQEVLKEANSDLGLRDLNHGEQNDYVFNYVDDDNDVTEQSNFIFDPDFDAVLFSLPQGQVSDVITLNSLSPYMYVVVYPIRIEKKDYQKLSDIVKQKLPSFTF